VGVHATVSDSILAGQLSMPCVQWPAVTTVARTPFYLSYLFIQLFLRPTDRFL